MLRTGQRSQQQEHNNAAAWTLAFSPDGQTWPVGGEDQTSCGCRNWAMSSLAGAYGYGAIDRIQPRWAFLVSAALNQSIRLDPKLDNASDLAGIL